MPDLVQQLKIKAVSEGFSQISKDLKELGDAGGKAESGMGKADKSAGMLGSSLAKLVAGGALGLAGKAMLDFGKASIAVASDVEEASSKFQYTFGPAAEGVGSSLDKFSEAANRSRFEMRSMAADVGALTESTLGSKEAAGDMSVSISKLAVDLASFNNVTEDEALTALKAGLIGESEPMRRFGVLLSAAAVETHILTTGMAATKGEITDAMKMQARYNIIMQQTATAQGDAVRTSDSYANVTRGLEASIQDLHAAIGNNLIPSMTEAKSVATDVIGSLAGFTSANNALNTAVADGVITQTEANRLTDRMALTGMDAADVMRLLKVEYQKSAIALEEMSAEAAGADQVFQRYIPTIAAVEEEIGGMTDGYKAALRVMGASSPIIAKDTRELEEMAYASGELGDTQDRLTGYLKADAEALKQQEEAAKRAAEAERALAAASGDYFTSAISGNNELTQALTDTGERTSFVSNLTGQQADDLTRMQTAYDKAAATIRDYELGVKGANLTDDARNKKIEEQMAIMATLDGNMQPLLAAGGEYVTTTEDGSAQTAALNNLLYEQADAAGADAETLALLAYATGDYSKEQLNAALQTAAVTAKAQELAQAMAEGTITVGEATQALQDFAQDWQAGALITVEDGSFRALLRDLVAFDGKTYRATASVDTSGGVPSPGGDGKTSGSGGDYKKPPEFAGGGVVPGPLNSPQLILAHGGETVIPPGQNSLTITQIFNGSSPNTMNSARDGVLEASRAIGLTGYA